MTIKIEDVTLVDKYWHVTRRATRRSNPTYCGLTESVYFQLSEFGLIQDVSEGGMESRGEERRMGAKDEAKWKRTMLWSVKPAGARLVMA